MATIRFEAAVTTVGPRTIVRLPESASTQLPSRGLVMVKGTINGFRFQCPLEPDGRGSHWLNLDQDLRAGAKAGAGDTVTLAIESTKDWPEPAVPADVRKALTADAAAHAVWVDITPMARWDWLRWINGTRNPATRQHRIEVMCSKLNNAKRRPCCFNRSECTDPEVSRGGILLEPTAATQ